MEKVHSPKIFIVDDDAMSLKMTQFHLGRLGYNDVSVFTDGTTCLNHLVDRPQIIFLDHMMSDLNGFEVLKKIKRFDPNIFVVMLSGQEQISIAVDSLKYGAFDYIIKGSESLDRVTSVLSRVNLVMEKLRNARPSVWKKIGAYI